jgi:hypothetical protein
MKHIQVYEAFNWETPGGIRLIIIEGTEPFTAEVQDIVHTMEEAGKLFVKSMPMPAIPVIKKHWDH